MGRAGPAVPGWRRPSATAFMLPRERLPQKVSGPQGQGISCALHRRSKPAPGQGLTAGSWKYERKVNPKYVETVKIGETKCPEEGTQLARPEELATLVSASRGGVPRPV